SLGGSLGGSILGNLINRDLNNPNNLGTTPHGLIDGSIGIPGLRVNGSILPNLVDNSLYNNNVPNSLYTNYNENDINKLGNLPIIPTTSPRGSGLIDGSIGIPGARLNGSILPNLLDRPYNNYNNNIPTLGNVPTPYPNTYPQGNGLIDGSIGIPGLRLNGSILPNLLDRPYNNYNNNIPTLGNVPNTYPSTYPTTYPTTYPQGNGLIDGSIGIGGARLNGSILPNLLGPFNNYNNNIPTLGNLPNTYPTTYPTTYPNTYPRGSGKFINIYVILNYVSMLNTYRIYVTLHLHFYFLVL
ncbi:uncharacterized protein LOC103520996, partial [Diaphorina citri]|uniref:Uncharacterized protein LOC103520996 n=1 Tax=Diaphorina citri TaxID=121845 RepID=A0A3Q0JLF4_DIACI